ncbi:MAG: dicarboxylate/amino acid:cation symporter [Sphingopyxis sp.]|nr:dicarboxylate/amino acid:cation symporter [Sphingopyxis sp.]
MEKRLAWMILGAVGLGLVAGGLIFTFLPASQVATVTDNLSIITDIFLRLIKMIIAPLVFATLVTGIAHMGDSRSLGRIGLRTMLWFVGASAVSISLGLILVNLFQPGVDSGFALPTGDSGIETREFTYKSFLTELVPTSIVDAMASNQILQIVIFSLFFGVALAASGKVGEPLLKGIESLVDIMLRITNYVMRFAPIAVFAAVTSVIASNGFGVLAAYGLFIGGFYVGLLILWLLLFATGALVFGLANSVDLARAVKEPLVLAFSTASSEAAYPKTLSALEQYGVPRRVASFVLPLGYSFNLDGSMMYCSFAILFIAQAYGIELSVLEQITALLLLMVTSKGMAGVPRASLVVIASTLGFLGIPEAGLLLILGIDQFLDMGRSATNVVGNAVATTVVARWEGDLKR